MSGDDDWFDGIEKLANGGLVKTTQAMLAPWLRIQKAIHAKITDFVQNTGQLPTRVFTDVQSVQQLHMDAKNARHSIVVRFEDYGDVEVFSDYAKDPGEIYVWGKHVP